MAEYILSEDTLYKIKQDALAGIYSSYHVDPSHYAGSVRHTFKNGHISEYRLRETKISTGEVFELLKQRITHANYRPLFRHLDKATGPGAKATLNQFRQIASEIKSSETAVGIMWDMAKLESAADLISKHWPEMGQHIKDQIGKEKDLSEQKLKKVSVVRLPQQIRDAAKTFSDISSFFGAVHHTIENAPDLTSAPIKLPVHYQVVEWTDSPCMVRCTARAEQDSDKAREGYLALFAQLRKDYAERADYTLNLAERVREEADKHAAYEKRLNALRSEFAKHGKVSRAPENTQDFSP